jgi:transcriptional regulator with XRE-family HTH domain
MLNYKIISKTRDKLGMTQNSLSIKTGIRKDIISKLENGRQMNPTLRTLEILARALEIPVHKLIDDSQITA